MLHSTPTSLSSLFAAATHICHQHIDAASTASGSNICDASSPIPATALLSSALVQRHCTDTLLPTPTPSSSSSAQVQPKEQEQELTHRLCVGQGVDFGDFQNLTE
ncbi:hypothetical protein C0995_007919, partial [Termitomyces sp. Mi166